ncbi:hypothetical protein GT2_19_00610 [Parageobacillus thermoglucosidasius NBRC 107763]|nr:hypothetical protein WH82_08430 [Parageobacillus thermoglucosidasius]GAJ44656.1 hypothetical protein GT2_19_00610 [Parageobacillus thermoglucosidasius NBRC 107763]
MRSTYSTNDNKQKRKEQQEIDDIAKPNSGCKRFGEKFSCYCNNPFFIEQNNESVGVIRKK